MRFLRFLQRRDHDEDLARELEAHVQHETDQYIAQGVAPEVARRRARIRLGNETRIREQVWEWNSMGALESVVRDLRYAARKLGRNPGFALVTAGLLALGIGANSALFTVVHSVLLKPLPFPQPDRLVRLYERSVDPRFPFNVVAPGVFAEWQKQSDGFAGMAIMGSGSYNLSGGNGQLPEKIEATRCSAEFFDVLGIRPAHGRFFGVSEDQPRAEAVVVLSWGLWKRRFGGDPNLVGSQVLFDGARYTVVGITPRWFAYPDMQTQAWTPIYHEVSPSAMSDPGNHQFDVIARLKAGVSQEQARAQIDTITRRLREMNPDKPSISVGANLQPLLDAMVSDFKTPLFVLLAATSCLLLIVCINVASLLTARAAAQRREMAVRVALGGTRWRRVREQLSEILLLACVGGTLGLVLGNIGVEWLLRVRQDIAREEAIRVDWVVILATMGMTLSTALLAGMLPALSTGGRNAADGLQESSRTFSCGRRRSQVRKVLLAAEVCLTVVLLIAAGLLLRSYQKLRTVDLGCTTKNVLTMRLSLPKTRYPEASERTAFFTELLSHVRALPGVEAAGATTAVPGQGYTSDNCFEIPGHPALAKGAMNCALERSVDPGYFEAIQIPLLRGRSFNGQEGMRAADSVIVSQSFVNKYFPGEEPLGRHLDLTADQQRSMEIVGVVGDTRYLVSEPVQPMIYLPLSLGFRRNAVLVIRSTGEVSSLAVPVQAAIQSVDRDLPVAYVLTMDQLMGASTIEASFTSTLILAFAAVSLLLAAVGQYGVLSYLVAQRTNEMGVRIALGAQREQVLRLMLADGLKPAAIGILVGVLAGAAASQLIRSMLHGVRPLDPVVFGTMVAVVVGVATVSCLIPAWRASRVNPMRALRVE